MKDLHDYVSGLNIKSPVSSFMKLPKNAKEGDCRITKDTSEFWCYTNKQWNKINVAQQSSTFSADSHVELQDSKKAINKEFTEGWFSKKLKEQKIKSKDSDNDLTEILAKAHIDKKFAATVLKIIEEMDEEMIKWDGLKKD